jgi:hypothetical protein
MVLQGAQQGAGQGFCAEGGAKETHGVRDQVLRGSGWEQSEITSVSKETSVRQGCIMEMHGRYGDGGIEAETPSWRGGRSCGHIRG